MTRIFYFIDRHLGNRTSVGANAEEEVAGISKAGYRMRFLNDSGYPEKDTFNSIRTDLTGLPKILFPIIKI